MDDKTIAVCVSGGVDSSVAAMMLKDAGCRVVGVTMKKWRPPADGAAQPSDKGGSCYGPGEAQAVAGAARVCQVLDIPFYALSLTDLFEQKILNLCRTEYLAGSTPSPCVYCNPLIKFKAIPDGLAAMGVNVGGIATGHYAQVVHDDARGRYLLRKGKDIRKDQTYFLNRLSQAQLGQTKFPVGGYTKPEIKAMARARGLPVPMDSESQDFINGGYHTLFPAEETPGPVVDRAGKVLGTHRGIHFYTIGQRRGLKIAFGKPIYVIDIRAGDNTLVVGPEEELYRSALTAGGLNWIAFERLDRSIRAKARIRYRHTEADATITPLSDDRVHVLFDEPQRAVTPGQAVVFYDGDLVLGGGIIRREPGS